MCSFCFSIAIIMSKLHRVINDEHIYIEFPDVSYSLSNSENFKRSNLIFIKWPSCKTTYQHFVIFYV